MGKVGKILDKLLGSCIPFTQMTHIVSRKAQLKYGLFVVTIVFLK